MRTIIVILLVSLSWESFSQSGQIIGKIQKVNDSFAFPYLTIVLTQATQPEVGTRPDTIGNFRFQNLKAGSYRLTIKQLGVRDMILDSLLVSETVPLELNFDYPQNCKFVYSRGSKPRCVYGHTDNIIPIVYGLPTKKTLKAAQRGYFFLGGCVVTDCDPQYYCKTHKQEL